MIIDNKAKVSKAKKHKKIMTAQPHSYFNIQIYCKIISRLENQNISYFPQT